MTRRSTSRESVSWSDDVTFLTNTFFSPFADTNSEGEDVGSQRAGEDEGRPGVRVKVRTVLIPDVSDSIRNSKIRVSRDASVQWQLSDTRGRQRAAGAIPAR